MEILGYSRINHLARIHFPAGLRMASQWLIHIYLESVQGENEAVLGLLNGAVSYFSSSPKPGDGNGSLRIGEDGRRLHDALIPLPR